MTTSPASVPASAPARADADAKDSGFVIVPQESVARVLRRAETKEPAPTPPSAPADAPIDDEEESKRRLLADAHFMDALRVAVLAFLIGVLVGAVFLKPRAASNVGATQTIPGDSDGDRITASMGPRGPGDQPPSLYGQDVVRQMQKDIAQLNATLEELVFRQNVTQIFNDLRHALLRVALEQRLAHQDQWSNTTFDLGSAGKISIQLNPLAQVFLFLATMTCAICVICVVEANCRKNRPVQAA